VLMPNTKSQCALDKNIPTHVPLIGYDAEYESRVARKLAGTRKHHYLSGYELDLTPETVGPTLHVGHPPRDVVNLKKLDGFANARLKPGLFDKPIPELGARVIVDKGGRNGHCPGSTWKVCKPNDQACVHSSPSVRMAHVLKWTIQRVKDDGPLKLTVKSLNGTGTKDIASLHPINKQIVLMVLHLVPSEARLVGFDVPDQEQEGAAHERATLEDCPPSYVAEHFAAYYCVLDNLGGDAAKKLPNHEDCGPKCDMLKQSRVFAEGSPSYGLEEILGIEMHCMLGLFE
jgi:hypothetical protein